MMVLVLHKRYRITTQGITHTGNFNGDVRALVEVTNMMGLASGLRDL